MPHSSSLNNENRVHSNQKLSIAPYYASLSSLTEDYALNEELKSYQNLTESMSDTKLSKQLTDIAQSTQNNSGKFNDLLNSDKTRALTSESKFSKSQDFVLNTDIFNLSQRTSTTVSPPTFFDPEIQQIDSCDFTRYNRKMKERRI